MQARTRSFSYRHLLPERHVLTADVLRKAAARDAPGARRVVDASKADPAIIRNFLQTGMREEIPDFVSEYLASLRKRAGFDALPAVCAAGAALQRHPRGQELRLFAGGIPAPAYLRAGAARRTADADAGKSCAALLAPRH
ncbi:MAG: hypothetical protein ACLS3C_10145 [Oscillospiraceae bacterium]